MQQIAGDSAVPNKNNNLIVPSIQTEWTPESVWDTGIVSSYSSSLYGLAVERFVKKPSVPHSMVLTFPSDTRLTTAPLYTPPLELQKTRRTSLSTFCNTTHPQALSLPTSIRLPLHGRMASRS